MYKFVLQGERYSEEDEWVVEYESYPWTTVKDSNNYMIPLHPPGNIARVSFHMTDSRGYNGFLYKYYAIGMNPLSFYITNHSV